MRDDLESQGLEAHSFDLVLTSDVTRLISPESLGAIRQLLTPTGWLLVQDAALPRLVEDNSRNGKSSAADAGNLRNELLQVAGLQCFGELVEEETNNESDIAKLTLLAKPAPDQHKQFKEITLLTGDSHSTLADTIASELVERGYTITWTTLSMLPPPGQSIISVLDLDGPKLHNLSKQDFQLLKDYLLNSQSKQFLWLTKVTQLHGNDPRYGLVHGLVRTLRQECGLDIYLLEVPEVNSYSTKLIIALQHWIEQDTGPEGRNGDSEFTILDEKLHVGRYHWVSELPQSELSSQTDKQAFRLQLGSNVSKQHCSWIPTVNIDLQEDQVQVDIRYVGLNFRVRSHQYQALEAMINKVNRMFWSQLVS